MTYTWVRKIPEGLSGLTQDGIVGKYTGNSVLDNLQGEVTVGYNWRNECYPRVPSTHRGHSVSQQRGDLS
ncbi:hypothetical protein [Streptomyces sp. NPDC048825]|uniref:hypothetical protein n=1 Tax=Streptomyces sp. NPDC048825 TaxID=3365592 RepID=UPI0037231C19